MTTLKNERTRLGSLIFFLIHKVLLEGLRF
jgi:hypothetical protein